MWWYEREGLKQTGSYLLDISYIVPQELKQSSTHSDTTSNCRLVQAHSVGCKNWSIWKNKYQIRRNRFIELHNAHWKSFSSFYCGHKRHTFMYTCIGMSPMPWQSLLATASRKRLFFFKISALTPYSLVKLQKMTWLHLILLTCTLFELFSSIQSFGAWVKEVPPEYIGGSNNVTTHIFGNVWYRKHSRWLWLWSYTLSQVQKADLQVWRSVGCWL